jgi:hypothetical protein
VKLHPLFKQFGSKWSSAKFYPWPEYSTIHEPFCGGAGYSLNHSERKVQLFDTDQNIAELWKWLIGPLATQGAIMEIPVGIPEGTDIRTVGLSRGQSLLLKQWQRTNNVGECWTISKWGHMPGQWTANTRARVAEEAQAVKHWEFLSEPGAFTPETTHFVDPPYKGNYAYRQPLLDFARLANEVQSGSGQIIVCEALNKDGTPPDWLPFEPLVSRVTSRRKKNNSHHRMEYIWQNS